MKRISTTVTYLEMLSAPAPSHIAPPPDSALLLAD